MSKHHITLLGRAGLLLLLLIVLFSFEWGRQDFAFEMPEEEGDSTEVFPQGFFMSPVSGTVRLTGTFGELRPDHFHSGLDFKSINGRVGQPVFAAADGFIDRIRVQASGYGNVLYIKHPNGYTTLYGHLDAFNSDVAAYVKAMQYENERFEIDLNPPDGKFRVKKGQEIGKMGNSGSSSGPHLHFEIRKTASGKVLNPERFGLPVPDQVAPEIRDMKVYFLDDRHHTLGARAFPLHKDKKGNIGIQGDTIRIGAWRVGFGVKAYDSMTGFKNDNGIYSLSLDVDDQWAYTFKMDQLDFDETRYINAHCDYPALKRFGAWFNRLYALPGNKLENCRFGESRGVIKLYEDKPVKVSINASDAQGNSTKLTFYLLRDADNMVGFPDAPHQYHFKWSEENRIELDAFNLRMGKDCLYEDLPLAYRAEEDLSSGIYSMMHQVHERHTPVHKYYEISIKPTSLAPELRDKAVIAHCGEGRPDNCGGEWKGELLSTRVRHFGDFCVMADTIAPKITPVVFQEDMRKNKTMAFQIRDNFGIDGTANGLSFRGTVDGKWVLFEYDKKRNRLTHVFDERIGPGEHLLSLAVRDDKGNKAVFERKFTR